jgi:hypothetical protein
MKLSSTRSVFENANKTSPIVISIMKNMRSMADRGPIYFVPTQHSMHDNPDIHIDFFNLHLHRTTLVNEHLLGQLTTFAALAERR